MPMLPDEVKVNALRYERYKYYLKKAEQSEAQLDEHSEEFMFLASSRQAEAVMPMLTEEVEVIALCRERQFWLDQASDVDAQEEQIEYYMDRARLCERDLAVYDITFTSPESEREALEAALDCSGCPFLESEQPDNSCACLESCPEE